MDSGDVSVDLSGAIVVGLVIASVAVFFYLKKKNNKDQLSNSSSSFAGRIENALRRNAIDITSIAAECKASGAPWKDPSFGHDAYPGGKSIGELELRDGERGKLLKLGSGGVSWQPPPKFAATPRPLGVRGDGVPTWLYSDNDGDGVVSAAESMEMTDAMQGSVGDCYFLSALAAAVQHHPDLADDLVDETYEEQGIYGVSFYIRGKWRMIWVDSFFPCYRPKSSSHRGKHRLIFAGASDRKELWPLVVEKAFAKLAGSYEAISGGRIAIALEMLTGGKGSRRRLEDIAAQWNAFQEQVKSDNYLVGAGSQQVCTAPSDAASQKKALKGIVTGHAYTVATVYGDGELRLIELRNPWGRGLWTGDWSSKSSKWNTEEGRKAISVVGPPRSQHGRFWMEWSDFLTCFDSVDICQMNFTAQDRERREFLRQEAAKIVAKQEHPNHGAGGGSVQPEYTQESADAMMAQLLAEEAKEKRMNQIGARGNKKAVRKKGSNKKRK